MPRDTPLESLTALSEAFKFVIKSARVLGLGTAVFRIGIVYTGPEPSWSPKVLVPKLIPVLPLAGPGLAPMTDRPTFPPSAVVRSLKVE